MGINIDFLNFLDFCFERNILKDPVIALGSQTIGDSEKDITDFAQNNSYKNLLKNKNVASLFRDRYKIDKYIDIDINGKAKFKLDLTKPLINDLQNFAGTVIDSGTTEHIFDIKQVFTNIHSMTKTNGTIIHIAPITWFNHGYINFNPLFFKHIAEANNYEIIIDAYFILKGFKDSNKNYRIFETLICNRNDDSNNIEENIQSLFNSLTIPNYALYAIAYKKTGNKPFQPPYDVY